MPQKKMTLLGLAGAVVIAGAVGFLLTALGLGTRITGIVASVLGLVCAGYFFGWFARSGNDSGDD